MEKRRLKKISDINDELFPETAIPHIEFESNRSVLVEGCHGIIEYDSDVVRINCSKLVVKFCGCDLSIRALSVDTICVSGKILSLEFLSL